MMTPLKALEEMAKRAISAASRNRTKIEQVNKLAEAIGVELGRSRIMRPLVVAVLQEQSYLNEVQNALIAEGKDTSGLTEDQQAEMSALRLRTVKAVDTYIAEATAYNYRYPGHGITEGIGATMPHQTGGTVRVS